jgi:hypothetical protein
MFSAPPIDMPECRSMNPVLPMPMAVRVLTPVSRNSCRPAEILSASSVNVPWTFGWIRLWRRILPPRSTSANFVCVPPTSISATWSIVHPC